MNSPIDPIAQMIDAYKEAVLTKNIDAFCALYDADIHIFDMWNHWYIQGIEAWKTMANAWFISLGTEYVTVDAHNVESVVTDDMAYGHAIFSYTAMSAQGEVLRTLDNRITIVLKRSGDFWKVIHEHTSAPIDHGSLAANLIYDEEIGSK